MRALLLEKVGQPLRLAEIPKPEPAEDQYLIKVKACAVCRTDLHLYTGELQPPHLPQILGHQIVGVIAARGKKAHALPSGTRVGISWLGSTCGKCLYCKNDQENLCEKAHFTGYDLPGGLAEWTTVKESFAYPLPESYSDTAIAPLLCGGIIGYRAYKKVRSAHTIGFYGFGSAAHLLAQLAANEGKRVIAFTRPGDTKTQQFALSVGAKAACDSDKKSPEILDAAIIFAADGALLPRALEDVRPGGTVICAEIYMSDIPSFSYAHIARERTIHTLSNLRRQDARDFLGAASNLPLQAHTQTFSLEEGQKAIDALLQGKIKGSAVILVD